MEERISRKVFEAENLKRLAERLKEIRKAVLGNQTKAGELLSCSQELVSKYESGERVPSIGFLQQFAQVADLHHSEEVFLLGLAGLVTPTRMPTIKQIQELLSPACEDIKLDWYPSMIIDYNFGIWAMNAASYEILGEIRTREIISRYVTVFEMLFSSELQYYDNSIGEVVTNELFKTRQRQIALFKFFNLYRRHEPFYIFYPEHRGHIGNNPIINKRDFEVVWKTVNVVNKQGVPQSKEGSIEIKGVLPARGTQSINYRMRLEAIAHSPMFGIMRFEPFPEFHSIFDVYKSQRKNVMKLWEITQTEAILRGINRLNLLED